MPLTPQEVASKVFGPTRLRRGYDENEVDAFLDQVETELTRLTTENERLRQELEVARQGQPAAAATTTSASVPAPEAAPEAAPDVATPAAAAVPAVSEPAAAPEPSAPDVAVEQQVARMLVLAQQTADAALREAQTDADRARTTARTEADRILNEARGRAAAEMGSLERNKQNLEGEVEHLQAFEREYRLRLRAYLEMQLRDLDGAGAAAVEARRAVELSAGSPAESGEDAPAGETSAGVDPLSAGFSDPPGFGAVWSPENGGHSTTNPLATGLEENDPAGGGSPFDTGGEGQRSGGFGAL